MIAAARSAIEIDDGPMTVVGRWRYLPMRIRLAEPFDDDALFEFCVANKELRIERTSDGDLIIMAPAGGTSSRRNFCLVAQFATWADRDGTGVAFESSCGFRLPNGA